MQHDDTGRNAPTGSDRPTRTGPAEPSADPDAPTDADTPTVVPLSAPADGVPDVVTTADGVRAAADLLASGHGPLAVDAERASGYRYSSRAYLVQFRRAGAGTVLLDPIPTAGDLGVLAEVVNPLEWVLHSADQDLPGLDEIGLRPDALYDTELAGRLAGFDRVGLAAMVERELGRGLAKGHGAADWSTRPLPPSWLNYAALDVEVLVELRERLVDELDRQDKTEWAAQEFEHVRLAGPPAPKPDRWRRTSKIHTLRSRTQLAIVRELWTARDAVARDRDVSPGRVLPDSAIVAAASAAPRSVDQLRALPVFGGPRQRRRSRTWQDAIDRALALPADDLPPSAMPHDGPPPVGRWARHNPDAAHRLDAARTALAALSEQVSVPVENLVSPDLVRRVAWDWENDAEPAEYVERRLVAGGARPWQRELAGTTIARAVDTAGPTAAS